MFILTSDPAGDVWAITNTDTNERLSFERSEGNMLAAMLTEEFGPAEW